MSDVWLSEDGTLSKHFDHVPAEDARGAPVAEAQSGSESRLTFSGVRTISATEEAAPLRIRQDVDLELDMDDQAGLLLRTGMEVVWSAKWSDLVKCSTPERLNVSSGGRGVLLEVVAHDRPPLLAVLPTERPGRVEKAIKAFRSRHGVAGRRSSPAAWVVAVAVVAVAVMVTAFLVAAGHALHL